MSTAIPTALDLEPLPRPWSETEFQEMGRRGWFAGQPVEWLAGEVVIREPDGSLTPFPWTTVQYHQMIDLGWFTDQYVELIGGEILQMPNPANPHCVSLQCTYDAILAVYPPGRFWVRMQMALALGMTEEPCPDLAVVPGSPRSFTAHPTTALLVIEISDSMLSYDRNRKASLYAAGGIQDYWIVNLVDRQLEVRRIPVQDPGQPFGARFASATVHQPGDRVAPLAAPQSAIAVADLLP